MSTESDPNYHAARFQSEAVALELALARIQQLEADNDELRQRLFELQEAKAALTPKI